MQKKINIFYLCLSLILVPLFLTNGTLAAPAQPARVINHMTKECGSMYTGDECETCVPTNGWEILNGDCPQGYTDLGEKLLPVSSCTFSERPYCCTEGHNGVYGACRNLVINSTTEQCILVNSSNACSSYPDGWRKSLHDQDLCSENYEWIDTIDCSSSLLVENENPLGASFSKYVLIGSILVILAIIIIMLLKSKLVRV